MAKPAPAGKAQARMHAAASRGRGPTYGMKATRRPVAGAPGGVDGGGRHGQAPGQGAPDGPARESFGEERLGTQTSPRAGASPERSDAARRDAGGASQPHEGHASQPHEGHASQPHEGGEPGNGAERAAKGDPAAPPFAAQGSLAPPPPAPTPELRRAAVEALAGRPLALVGLMGVGKTTVGRQIASVLDLPFEDADEAIEKASRMSVSDLFAEFGEGEFRALERRVIERIAREGGAMVLATGGGAFANDDTRAVLLEGATTVWLRAPLDVLVERTSRRKTRPLLAAGDPRAILAELMEARHPHYARADLTVDSVGERRETVASRVVHALAARGEGRDGS